MHGSNGSVSSVTADDVDDAVADLLREADQRYTSGRQRLVAALQAGDGPLTIAQILEADDSQVQSSVYRNLTILESAGAVTRIVTSDEYARYELAEHLTGHHHHLICRTCGGVEDFSLDSKTEYELDQAFHQAGSQTGFLVEEHRLDLLGTCQKCT